MRYVIFYQRTDLAWPLEGDIVSDFIPVIRTRTLELIIFTLDSIPNIYSLLTELKHFRSHFFRYVIMTMMMMLENYYFMIFPILKFVALRKRTIFYKIIKIPAK